MLKENGEIYNFGHDNVNKIWNSEHACSMRRRMINDEQVTECKFCWNEESVGKRSKRIKENVPR